MRRALLALLALVITLVVVSCQQKKSCDASMDLFPVEKEGKVVAEFDGIKITDKYLEAYIGQLNPYIKARYNNPEKKMELIERILEGEVLARAALKKGSVNDPVLLTKIKSTIARYYTGKDVKIKIEEKVKVTEEEMKKYFEENKEKYNQPEKRKASHILLKVAESAKDAEWKKAEKMAKKVLTEVKAKEKNPKSFSVLAKKYSEDTGSKRRGGDVGYFAKSEEGGKMVKEFSDAAFSLAKVGDLSGLVKSKFGYHIVKLTGKRDAVIKMFPDVKARIESSLKAEKRKTAYKDAIKEIQQSMGFKMNEENAKSIDMNIPASVKDSAKTSPGGPSKMRPKIDKKGMRNALKELNKRKGQKVVPGQPIKLDIKKMDPVKKAPKK